jgi:hypothetical protein
MASFRKGYSESEYQEAGNEGLISFLSFLSPVSL